MRDWILYNARFVLSNWQIVLVGGICVVGVIMFLMGVLKKSLVNRIKNKMLRKTVLSFLSVILVAPSTLVQILCEELPFSQFWVIYTINVIATIVLYWFYEGTHIRELLALIGKNVLKIFVGCLSNTEKDLQESLEDAKDKATETAVNTIKEHKYNEKDLDNL